MELISIDPVLIRKLIAGSHEFGASAGAVNGTGLQEIGERILH
jgi:hypothetical protein